MTVIPYNSFKPKINENIFLAPDSWIIGDVSIDEGVSVFFGVVLRGDILPINIGTYTNIQEHSLLHTSTGLTPCLIGDHVTIGHRVIVHGAKIDNLCIIGMGSTILDGAHIQENCIVGANSLITMNKTFPPNSMIMGSPAKVIRELTEKELLSIRQSADDYCKKGIYYRDYFLGQP